MLALRECRNHSTFQCEALIAACFMLVSYFAYSSTLKMEVMCSSKTLVDYYWTTWRYIPEDGTL
jgi:hypothetical protein